MSARRQGQRRGHGLWHVLLLLPRAKSKLSEIVNSLILPPRFSAIYHMDTNTMEYIYTRLKLDDPILSRQFIFNLDDKQYLCKFDIRQSAAEGFPPDRRPFSAAVGSSLPNQSQN